MLASHGLRTGVPVLDGVSVFPRFVSPCLQLFRYMYAGCWMVCPPSLGLVSPSLRLCSIVSHMCACVRCCVRLPEVLSPIVFPHMCACVGWCVRLSPLVSLSFPHIVAHVSLRWKVCSPSRGLVSPLSPHIYTSPYPPPCPNASHCFHCPPLLSLSPHMRACGWWARLFEASLCWMVRPHSRALVSPGLPACLPCLPMCACGGWCARLSEVLPRLVSLCWMLSPCSPFVGWCVRVSEALSPFLFAFRGLVLPCPPFFPLSSRMCAPHVCLCCVTAFLFFLHMCACVGWCVRLPEVLPPLVSHSLPFCVPVFGWYDPLSPIVLPTYVPALDFRGLASACLSLSPHKCACPGWCVRFPEIFSLTFSSFLCPFVGWYARFPVLSPLVSLCLPLPPIVCHCLPTCESAFPRSCLPLCPFLFPFVGWCVCRPLALDYLPLSPFLFPFLWWCAVPRTCPPACLPACLPACQVVFPSCSLWCLPSSLFPCLPACLPAGLCSCFPLLGGVSVFPLVSHVSLLFSLCWMVCPPSQVLVRLSPSLCTSLSSFLLPFVGGCVHLPTVLSLLSPSLSSSLFPSLPPSLSPRLSLPCSPAKIFRTPRIAQTWKFTELRDWKWCVIFHFHPSMFSTHPIWQSYAACFERLEPNTCTPIGCFLRRFSASSVATKQAKPNKINVYKVVCGTFCRYVH